MAAPTLSRPKSLQLVDELLDVLSKDVSNKKEYVHSDLNKDGNWPLPGEVVIDLTYDLDKDLDTLKQRFGGKYKKLLEQSFEACDEKSDNGSDNSISVLQFNMLSDALSDAYAFKMTPKSFIGVDKDCLRWTYRGLRLLELLRRYDADIVCIEEMDEPQFFIKYLGVLGYDCYHQPKAKSPTRHIAKQIIEERPNQVNAKTYKLPGDGPFIAFKKDKFEMSADMQRIDDSKNTTKVVGLAMALRSKSIKNCEFLVLSTHLKSTKDKIGEELRSNQANELFTQILSNPKDLPIIVGCDLNANPIVNKNGYAPECYEMMTGDKIGCKSVYRLGSGDKDCEPEYTTWKLREHGTDKHTIDYIFLKGNRFTVTHLLSIPKADDKAQFLIPGWQYPSDHFAIGCHLQWN